MHWEIIDTGVGSAEENMRFDAEMLETLGSRARPILHFYDWAQDSATYGYFIDPKEFLNLDKASQRKLELARRPTGGGIVFHVWDLAFSVLVPASCEAFSLNTLENYAFVNNAVKNAVKEFLGAGELDLTPNDAQAMDASCSNFCMARPTKYDVMLGGKKVAGAAQRKRKHGFLHQGTIALVMPPEEYLRDILAPGTAVFEATMANTWPLLGKETTRIGEAKKELKHLLKKHVE